MLFLSSRCALVRVSLFSCEPKKKAQQTKARCLGPQGLYKLQQLGRQPAFSQIHRRTQQINPELHQYGLQGHLQGGGAAEGEV